MSGKERNDTENKINSTDETVFSIMANGPESSKPIMAFRSREDAAYFLECLQQASGIMGGDTTYSIVDLIRQEIHITAVNQYLDPKWNFGHQQHGHPRWSAD